MLNIIWSIRTPEPTGTAPRATRIRHIMFALFFVTYGAVFLVKSLAQSEVGARKGWSTGTVRESGFMPLQEVDLPEGGGIATALWLAGSFRFLVGTNWGDPIRFDWARNEWANPVTLAQSRAGFITPIRGDRRKPGHLWVTYSDVPGPTVHRSDDDGDE